MVNEVVAGKNKIFLSPDPARFSYHFLPHDCTSILQPGKGYKRTLYIKVQNL